MNTLDENKLRNLIATLQTALKYGFESSSSPIEILFEVVVDLILQISESLTLGVQSLKANEGIKFLENAPQDALGNTRSIRIREVRKFLWDPAAAQEVKQTALDLVALKNRLLGKGSKRASIPVVRSISVKKLSSLASTKIHKNKAQEFVQKNKQIAYYRRQRKRKDLSKST
jgi:hypothetical protein